MEYPFGHPNHSHTHHHQRDEEEYRDRREEYPPPGTNSRLFDQPPPPPQSAFYGRQEPPYPPPPSAQVTHVQHSSHAHYPPPASDGFNYSSFPPPPPQDYQSGYGSAAASRVQHVSHSFDQNPIGESETHYSHNRPYLPSFDHHQTHQRPSSDLANIRTFKVVSKAEANFSLTIRDGKVILARSDPSDEFQHWYKDEKYSTRVKDEEGCPCFSLVNKATGQAMKHSLGASHPVQLIPYVQDRLDESILWTESRDLGDGFRTIRMVNNVHLNVDAFHGDKHSGGVHDGATIVLWAWNKGDNQRWKIVPYYYQSGYGSAAATTVQHVSHSFDRNPIGEFETHHSHNRPHLTSFDHHQRPYSDLANKRTFKVVSKAEANFSLTIRDGMVILARSDPSDVFQHWYKDVKYSTRVKDDEGCPCFSLVNKATGQALKHSLGASHPVQLIPYIQDRLDESVLWTESRDLGDGFRTIRMVNNVHLNVDAFHGDKHSGGVHDGTTIVLWAWNKGDNQRWKIVPY